MPFIAFQGIVYFLAVVFGGLLLFLLSWRRLQARRTRSYLEECAKIDRESKVTGTVMDGRDNVTHITAPNASLEKKP
jgi:hypothetical protein